MFAENELTVILGVATSLLFIIGSIFFISKILVNHTQEVLVKFILLVFTSLVALFIVDKVVAFKIELLEEDQNMELFELIKTLVLMVFSYYFGTKTNEQKEK